MFVKICGVRDVATARSVADCGPDAIGLNFYPLSPRSLDLRMAERITRALPLDVEPIGVFVNHSGDEIREIAAYCRLKTVQLHGDEAPALAAELVAGGLEVIRALRLNDDNVSELPALIAAYRGIPLRAMLVDARVAGAYGGSGKTAPWSAVAEAWQCDWPPLLLAGGLTPANVGQAVAEVGPWGVDTAGGVETAPGVKDTEKVREFVAAARGSV